MAFFVNAESQNHCNFAPDKNESVTCHIITTKNITIKTINVTELLQIANIRY